MSNDNEWKLRHLEYTEIPELKRNIRELRERVFQLEERERVRSREEHDIDFG